MNKWKTTYFVYGKKRTVIVRGLNEIDALYWAGRKIEKILGHSNFDLYDVEAYCENNTRSSNG